MLYDFKFGGPISKNLFFNRVKELEIIYSKTMALEQGICHNYALVGPRRIGKSSLLNQLMCALSEKKQIIPVFIDCEGRSFDYSLKTPELLLNAWGNAILDAFFEKTGENSKIGFKLSSTLSEAREAVTATLAQVLGAIKSLELKAPQSYLSLRIDFEKKNEKLTDKELFALFEQTMQLPEKLALEKNVFFLMILDEFQETAVFKKPFDFITAFRRHMQAQRRVSYILSGSNIGMMKKILFKKHFGGHLLVNWITGFTKQDSINFLKQRLTNTQATEEILNEIFEFTAGNPAYLNWFIQESSSVKKLGLPAVNELKQKFFSPQGLRHVFEEDLLRVSHSRKSKLFQILESMSVHDLSSPTQIARFVPRVTPSEVIIYLKRLEERGIVERISEGNYRLIDAALKNYIKYNAIVI